MIRFSLALFSVLIGVTTVAQSAELHPEDAARHREAPELDGLEADLYRREGEVALPKGYDEAGLQWLDIDGGPNGFRYAMDARSVTYGVNNTVRYILVVESASGARNAYFEAMRCNPPEYRTYGYADASGQFRRSRKSRWIQVGRDPWQMRESLAEQVICDYWSKPVEEYELMERLKGFGNNRWNTNDPSGFH